jgi:hypothetical protein
MYFYNMKAEDETSYTVHTTVRYYCTAQYGTSTFQKHNTHKHEHMNFYSSLGVFSARMIPPLSKHTNLYKNS